MSLLGLGTGIMFAVFHILGMMLVFSAKVYSCVIYVMALGPRCFKCCMFMLSGPSDLLFFECLSACFVWSSVSVIGVGESDFTFFWIFRLFLCVLCVTVFMNCLLNSFALSVLVVTCLSLNVSEELYGCVGFLFDSVFRVFHSM